MQRIVIAGIQSAFLLLIDFLAYGIVKDAVQYASPAIQSQVNIIFWGISALIVGIVFAYHLIRFRRRTKTSLLTIIFTQFMSKLFLLVFGLIDSLRQAALWSYNAFASNELAIGPSAEIAQAGLWFALLPIAAISYGIIRGAHHYQLRKEKVMLPQLPKAFDGLKIVQISDIHSGSFWDKEAVEKGIDMIMEEKPDLIFFTGDLVNNRANEIEPYMDIFSRLEAPLGVYSILGNHDYGDYVYWSSLEAKQVNLNRLIENHRKMGWDLLLNEHRILEKDGQQIAVLGIENWSAKGNFPKYGKMEKAYPGLSQVPVKLLLSHDPSHWRGQVLNQYQDIDITFSGHTHGMQFGVEGGGFKWSPVQYMYPEWGGLYKEGDQYLYVNRGFGYLGFPGRIGMRPEITLIELRRGE